MSTVATHPVQEVLHGDHERLDAIYAELVGAVAAGVDTRTLYEIWERFDHGIRSHLSAEEELVFPLVEDQHPAEVAELRADHRRILAILDGAGVDVELHMARSPEIVDLVDTLKRHAAHEDAGVYLWAGDAARDLAPRLAARLRRRAQQ